MLLWCFHLPSVTTSLTYFALSCLPILICVAFFTLIERKILSLVGFRLGPYKVSFLGIFQPIGDAVKLGSKSVNSLSSFSLFFYYFSSVLMISVSIFLFSCLNVIPSPSSLKFSFLFFLIALSLNSLNSILVGWSAYSKFSLIGSIRTVSQLISYEAVLYLCLFFIAICFCTFDFSSFSFFPLLFCFLIFCSCFFVWVPTMLAELNRTPFDFSEGESELVSGFNTEFGSGCFTLVFLAEYSNMVFFCLLTSFIFFTPLTPLFFFLFFFLVWIRSVLPRFRFDKLMLLAWKMLIPFLTFVYCFFLLFLF